MKDYGIDLDVGLALHLAALGLARYNASGAYSGSGLPAVFFGDLPDKPDAAILINGYYDDRDTVGGDDSPTLRVQLRFRTTGEHPHTTRALAESAFEAIHDRSNFVLPNGIRVLLCRRTIAGSAAKDQNRRYTRPDSYRFTLNPS